MITNPLTAIDFYKADHRRQYPDGTTEVYSNFTARSSNHARVIPELYDNQVVFFGLQYFIKDYLQNAWNMGFFSRNKDDVINVYQRRMDLSLGDGTISVGHISDLHDLGFLPLKIKALPEGMLVPVGVPMLTIVNTHPDFFWLTNYIETVMSAYLWKPITSATTALQYKRLLYVFYKKTGLSRDFADFQVHDFSFRGMSSLQSAAISGAARS
jgi:nicotinamide phosphoribosyltransferase